MKAANTALCAWLEGDFGAGADWRLWSMTDARHLMLQHSCDPQLKCIASSARITSAAGHKNVVASDVSNITAQPGN